MYNLFPSPSTLSWKTTENKSIKPSLHLNWALTLGWISAVLLDSKSGLTSVGMAFSELYIQLFKR